MTFSLAALHAPSVLMMVASVLTLLAIGNPRRPAWQSWRWLWVYLFLSALLNVLTALGPAFGVSLSKMVANVGRILYMPPLLLGLAVVVGQPRYRTYARLGVAVLLAQLLLALVLVNGDLMTIPTIRTSITHLLITAIVAPGVLARLPRVRGSVFRDPPMIALTATLLSHASQIALAPVQAALPKGSPMLSVLSWSRTALWIVAYLLWWYAFREARRQARTA